MSQDTVVTLRVKNEDYFDKINRRGSWSNFESSLKRVPSSVSQFLSKPSNQRKSALATVKSNDEIWKSTKEALWKSSNLLNNVTAELCYTQTNEGKFEKQSFSACKSSSFRSEKNPIIRILGESVVNTDCEKYDKKRLCKSYSAGTLPTTPCNEEINCVENRSSSLEIVSKPKMPPVSVSQLVFGTCKIGYGSYINSSSSKEERENNFPEESKFQSISAWEKEVRCTDINFDNLRLENIILETLKETTKLMSYDPFLSISRSQHISEELVDTVKEKLSHDTIVYKVVAQVFLGALKDNGFCFATQCSFEPLGDLFASSIVNTDDMFVCAIVKAAKCTAEEI